MFELPMLCPICNKEVTMTITDFKQEEHDPALVQHTKAQLSCGHRMETMIKFPKLIELRATEKICEYDGNPCFYTFDCDFCHIRDRAEEISKKAEEMIKR